MINWLINTSQWVMIVGSPRGLPCKNGKRSRMSALENETISEGSSEKLCRKPPEDEQWDNKQR